MTNQDMLLREAARRERREAYFMTLRGRGWSEAELAPIFVRTLARRTGDLAGSVLVVDAEDLAWVPSANIDAFDAVIRELAAHPRMAVTMGRRCACGHGLDVPAPAEGSHPLAAPACRVVLAAESMVALPLEEFTPDALLRHGHEAAEAGARGERTRGAVESIACPGCGREGQPECAVTTRDREPIGATVFPGFWKR